MKYTTMKNNIETAQIKNLV